MKSVQLSANSRFWPVENRDAFWASLFVAPGIQNVATMGVKLDQKGIQRFENCEQKGVQKNMKQK